MKPAKVLKLSITSVKTETSEYDKDIWDVRNLGIKFNESRCDYKLNFTKIPQVWLRQATKHFIRYTLAIYSFSEAGSRLSSLKRFSKFLEKFHPSIRSLDINRSLTLNFCSYLS